MPLKSFNLQYIRRVNCFHRLGQLLPARRVMTTSYYVITCHNNDDREKIRRLTYGVSVHKTRHKNGITMDTDV